EMLRHAFKTKSSGKRSGVESEDVSVAPSGAQTPVVQSELGPVEARHIEQAKTLLRPFVLRRRKVDVLGDLPKKTEHITRIDLTEAQRALYDQIMPEESEGVRQQLMQLEVGEESSGAAKQKQSWISTFMEMRKVADHPLLLRSHYTKKTLEKMAKQLLREPDYADANYTYVLEDMEVCSDFELHKICTTYPRMQRFKLTDSVLVDSGKVSQLKLIVDECVEKKEKLLVFSQFTSMLDVLESVLGIWQVEYCRLDGQTKVDERQAMIDEFNNTERFPVFLLSTKAGGFGINLTSANVVVIFDSGNNPSEERQAEDRAHRVGQTKDVRVYRFIANGTIDEDIWECSRSKMLMEQCFWLEGLGTKAEE
ncbi:DNA-dependent ATPase fun30, partial [Linderina pennispora]